MKIFVQRTPSAFSLEKLETRTQRTVKGALSKTEGLLIFEVLRKSLAGANPASQRTAILLVRSEKTLFTKCSSLQSGFRRTCKLLWV